MSDELRDVVRQLRAELEWAMRFGIELKPGQGRKGGPKARRRKTKPAYPETVLDARAFARRPSPPPPEAKDAPPPAASAPPPPSVSSVPAAATSSAAPPSPRDERGKVAATGLTAESQPSSLAESQAVPAAASPALSSAESSAPSSAEWHAPSAGGPRDVVAPAAMSPPAEVERPGPTADAISPSEDARALANSTRLAEVRAVLGDCQRCKLAGQGRKQIVFGVGSEQADVMFVGEGPGAEEDRRGEPFVGKAGQLLTRIIENGMKMARSEVYIANIVKCRPPGNRDPEPDEVAQCRPFLEAQIRAVGPKVIITLGRYATQALLGTDAPMGRLRGRWAEYQGTPVMPTFHPAYVLRNPEAKRPVWEDIQAVLNKLGDTSS